MAVGGVVITPKKTTRTDGLSLSIIIVGAGLCARPHYLQFLFQFMQNKCHLKAVMLQKCRKRYISVVYIADAHTL